MKTEIIESVLDEFDFIPIGEIRIDEKDGYPRWYLKPDWKEKVAVYLWVEKNKDKYIDIVYVGKAGKGLQKRADQHRAGYKGNSITGKKNGDNIRKYLTMDRNNKIEIYARKSRPLIINDEEIPSVSADEESFIKKFTMKDLKLWNKANKE